MTKLKLIIDIFTGLVELGFFLYVCIGQEWERFFAILVIGILMDIRRKTKGLTLTINKL